MKTKSVVISIIAILFCFSSAPAQIVKGYGIKTGAVISNQHFEYAPEAKVGTTGDKKNRTGFDFGISLEWFNLPFFSLLTEVHYAQKGMIEEIPKTNEYGQEIAPRKYDKRIDYLSLPILAKIALNSKHITPYLVIGPRFDFNLDLKSDVFFGWQGNEFKNVDVGGTLGVGVESKSEPLKAILEFRYSPDFTYAYKSDLLKIKNRSFEILFGIAIRMP